ncbi:penicillin acylase family protein [Thiorhodococcus mannitoliphagus]|uniref:Penicillin acylase family protein n=1 Tax=Thiorhodococcus mannitoliphagus TaxID=329406 RepID=A0A6P1DTI7_9GAMM|nr:penicillin acylase family protein [Thiorhodococcus mannitoliphagus]NEX21637.1 penicillin acylase family protein [Thiorhodococcus mannitoliphagus]
MQPSRVSESAAPARRIGRSWRRAALRVLLGAALLASTAVAGLLLWIGASLPPLDGEERVAGPTAEVVLERDRHGRVTIRADSEADAALGIGYAHGQDRFFQMDLLRRVGAGTLAALIGPSGLPADEGARRHDLPGTARTALEQATKAERIILDAYAKGVNAGLASLRARPWEYILLRQRPEPWLPRDSYAVGLAMFRDLQDGRNRRERVLDAVSRALTPDVFKLLTTSPGPWEAPVEGEAGAWPQVRIAERGARRQDSEDQAHAVIQSASVHLDSAYVGSNAFAVAGSLTPHGRAILANDMHLGLQVPTTWYPIRILRAGERPLDAVGVSLPGAPALIVGSNGHIAWGLTNSYGDWLDHVVLEMDPDDEARYRTPDGWKRLRQRQERIEVAGGEPISFAITESIWGPVVAQDHLGRPLALRWVAQEPDALNLRLLELAEATSVEQALDLAPQIGVPAQNLIVAGADGSVGWTLMGRIPHRLGLNGPQPRSWADAATGWHGWLDAVPRIDPGERRRLWTANARVVDLAEQGLIGDGGYALGARARRIRDLLDARDQHDEHTLFRIQLDTKSELMALWYERLRALVETDPMLPERNRLLSLLEDWTGEAATHSVAYRLAHDWRTKVSRRLLYALGTAVPEFSDPLAMTQLPRTEVAVWAILNARPEWIPPGYRDWPEFERACLEQVLAAWGEPSQWASRTWGKRNTTAITHPLSQALPHWLGRAIDLPPREVPGDAYVPRVATPSFGASERLVVAPGAESEGILQLPGGPNAHPFAPMRLRDYDAWVAGVPVPLLPGPPAHRRRLVPADGP